MKWVLLIVPVDDGDGLSQRRLNQMALLILVSVVIAAVVMAVMGW